MIDTQALRDLAEHVSWEGPGLGAGALLNEAADALDAMQWRKEPPDSEGWWASYRLVILDNTYGTTALWKLRDGVLRAGYLRTDNFRVGDYLWLKLPDPEGT